MMEKELPLFPLNLVAYPGHELNLHIFEPRYRQLVKDCLDQRTTFGIPSFVHKKMEYGTEVRILEVSQTYDDGKMDIKTEGISIIKVIEFKNPFRKKLYAGGPVEVLENRMEGNAMRQMEMHDLAIELFFWLGTEDQIEITADTNVYALAHKVGLSPEQEYDLLQILDEEARQVFLIQHLKEMIPALQKAETARERIRQNGHFKHLDPLKF
jgi:Lon protease-like protein